MLITLTLLLSGNSIAQTNKGGFPISKPTHNLRGGSALPEISMPEADFEADKKNQPACGNRFAHTFSVEIDVKENGLASESDGYNIWQLAIKSAGAHSLNLIFKQMNLPEGARLFLYSPNKEQMLGAYTEANNTPYRFATSPIDGEKIIVHYEEPQNAATKASVVISSVNHDYRGLKSLPSYGYSNYCEVNAAADTIRLNRHSTCLLLIDGASFCSGSLINNVENDANPYIVTSAHCFWTTDARGNYKMDTSKAQTTIAFFNYESPNAVWNIEGSRETSLSGGHTIAYRKRNDMLLIRLNEVPPVDYRPYYAGWKKETEIEAPVYVFHHPEGDIKKISLDDAVPSIGSFDNGALFNTKSHWRIYRWDSGMTEGGSSGSGLYDGEDLLIGCLTGGDTASKCSRPGDDYFWAFHKVWDDSAYARQNLGFWLDPNNTGATAHKGYNPYKNPCRRLTHLNNFELPAMPTDEEMNTSNYAAGTNKLGISEIAEKYVPGKASTLFGVYFAPIVGVYSENNPIYLRIYSGKDKPDSLIYEQKIKIQTSQLDMHMNWETVTTKNWSETENYQRLQTPVKVDSCFFVAFSIPSKTMRSQDFALYHSEEKEENTAYFFTKEEGWKPYNEHPTLKRNTALMADVVVYDGWDAPETPNPVPPEAPDMPVSPISKCDDIEMYPAFTFDELHIKMPADEHLKSIQIADMSGHTLFKQNGINATGTFDFTTDGICQQDNVYMVTAEFEFAAKKTFKFVKWNRKK